jgi:2-polyprenyl-6-methoxyphenol hydroxylase-like FAD-dependent oxidoreductase
MTFSITPPFGTLVDLPVHQIEQDAPGGSRAIVIGGSVGGLLAAQALARHFDEVVVLDRDSFPAIGEHRKGTPQSHHVHALLGRGLMTIERALPGFTADLVARGAMTSDALTNVRWHQAGGRHASGTAGFTAVVASRPLIEGVLRERVCTTANVAVREGVSVQDLQWNATRTKVTGVVASALGGEQPFDLAADLVVDASGRGSQLATWLERAGYERPPEQRLDVNVRYASRLFRRKPGDLDGNLVTIVSSIPSNPRGGLAIAIEGDRCLITLNGRNGLTPPTGLQEFVAYASELDSQDIATFLRNAEPIGEAATYSMPRCHRRFEQVPERFPAGLLPFADSMCGFNPIFGQGMSVAALEASVLDQCLAKGMDDLARRFLEGCTPIVDGAWKLATSNDLRFMPGRQPLPRGMRLLHWYLDQLNVAARSDVEVARAFAKVVHMMEPPPSLMRPAIVGRVMKARLGGRMRQPRTLRGTIDSNLGGLGVLQGDASPAIHGEVVP